MYLKKNEILRWLQDCDRLTLVNYHSRDWSTRGVAILWVSRDDQHRIVLDVDTEEWSFI